LIGLFEDFEGVDIQIGFSKRAKHLAVFVLPNGSLKLRVPFGADMGEVRDILKRHKKWLKNRQEFISQKFANQNLIKLEKDLFVKIRPFLENKVRQDLQKISNEFYKVAFNRVLIKDMKTRWGSANFIKKDIAINWRAAFLPDNLFFYLLVHELCHLIYPNHSANFWREVSRAVPDFLVRKRKLATTNMDFVSKEHFDRIMKVAYNL
jgi:hypothetical protein